MRLLFQRGNIYMFDLLNDVVDSTGDVRPGLQFGAHNGVCCMIQIPRDSCLSYGFKIRSDPLHSTLYTRLCYLLQDLGISTLKTMRRERLPIPMSQEKMTKERQQREMLVQRS
jgi:hypothetical protein